MDPDPSDKNDFTNSNYVDPSYVPPPPLYEAAFPFYQPETYSPVNQGRAFNPACADWYEPDYFMHPPTVKLNPEPADDNMGNSITDATVDDTSLIANSEEDIPSEAGKQGQEIPVYPCVKCSRVFYSSQALGGHMSAHAKQERKLEIMSQTKNAEVDEGGVSSPGTASKRKGGKRGKNVVIID